MSMATTTTTTARVDAAAEIYDHIIRAITVVFLVEKCVHLRCKRFEFV